MSHEPVYTAGSELTLTIPLVDEEGTQLDPVSYSYAVYDEAGVSVNTGSGSVGGGLFELELTISAAVNQLASGIRMGARQLIVDVVDTAANTHSLTETYILRASFVPLSVPSESGLTLLQANLLTRAMASQVLESFNHSDPAEREAALCEAWSRLSSLAYQPWREGEIPDPNLTDNVRCSDFVLNEITNADWLLLPENFRKALTRAQLIEASVLLGGDPTWELIQDGLSSKTVGESSDVFRSKPSNSILSPKAMREISGFLRQTMTIGRA